MHELLLLVLKLTLSWFALSCLVVGAWGLFAGRSSLNACYLSRSEPCLPNLRTARRIATPQSDP
jgi:hypothetical protein